ncbi:MAG: CARDB domain-containing protein [Chloroflexota bacterium]
MSSNRYEWILALVVLIPIIILSCSETAVPTPTPAPPTETPTAAPLPDLTIGYYTVNYDDCPWGGPGTMSVNVANVGAGDAGAFEVTINNGTTNVDGLGSLGETTASVPFAAGPVGGINAEVDSSQQVVEVDETNNSYNIVFTPPPPCATPAP